MFAIAAWKNIETKKNKKNNLMSDTSKIKTEIKNEPHCNSKSKCDCHYCLSSTEGYCHYDDRFEQINGVWDWKRKKSK